LEGFYVQMYHDFVRLQVSIDKVDILLSTLNCVYKPGIQEREQDKLT